MEAVRDVALVAAAILTVAGLVAVVALEFGASGRRLGGRWRDAIEVLLPTILTAVLLGIVFAAYGSGG